MAYCIRCVPFSCENASGIISLEWNTRGNLTYIHDDCSVPPSTTQPDTTSKDYIEGPTVGTVSLSSYAFTKGDDRWLGSRCVTNVQGSQVYTQKYDLETDKHYLIPSKSNTGQITGYLDPNKAKLGIINCSTTSYRAALVNGATLGTEMSTDLGGELEYKGYPISFKFPMTETAFNIYGQKTFLTGFSLNINFPEPAIVNYTFQFILDCGTSEFNGNGQNRNSPGLRA